MLARQSALAILGLALGCSGVENLAPIPPMDANRAIIGITIEPGNWPSVAFVKIGDGEDIRSASTWAQSYYSDFNTHQEGLACLFNVEPGEYVAVAARYDSYNSGAFTDIHEFVFLSEEVIQKTRVTVPPGGVVYMGEFKIDRIRGLKDLDPAQQHYRELLTSTVHGRDNIYYRAALLECHQDQEATERFFVEAEKLLRGSLWAPRLEAQRRQMQAHDTGGQ